MNTTIKTLAFSVIASFVFMGGCVSKLTTVNFDYPSEGIIETDAQQNVGTHTFGETVITSDLKKSLEENNTSIDLLDELKLKSAQVSIEVDPKASFDNIEAVQLWITTDGQPEVLLASKTSVPDGLKSIMLDVNNSENLANYLKAEKFTYRIKGTNTGALPEMTMKVNAIWNIKASAK